MLKVNLFNNYIKKKLSGMIMPAAVALTFGTMMLTVGYMERVLNKKIQLDIRVAKTKARLNAESGASITISGSTDDGFISSLGSSDWPNINTLNNEDPYEEDIIDTETFPSLYEPEKITSFFPNAGIANSPDIDMGEFYNIRLEAKTNQITRRPERSGLAYGRAKVKNIFGDDIYVTDSAQVKFSVEVLSDFMYLTHHEFAGGAPSIFGPNAVAGNGPSDHRRQPCFGPDDELGTGDQSLVGFVQTLDPMQFCTATPVFENLVYVTEATCNSETDPPCWVDAQDDNGQEYNWTSPPYAEGAPIFPNGYTANNINGVFQSNEATHEDCFGATCGWEKKDPVCFPLTGYKETVLGATAYHTYDSTEMLRFSNQGNLNSSLKDTLIMTEIDFLSQGGYVVRRWWYLMPPYLRSGISAGDLNGDLLDDLQFPMPYQLEGMPTVVDPANPTFDELEDIRDLCDGTIDDNLVGDMTQCEPYAEALHDFSSLLVEENPTRMNNMYMPFSYVEEFNNEYNGAVANNHDGGPGGGVTRLSHYDIENFTNSPQNTGINTNNGYFENKGMESASNNWDLELPISLGGNLLQEELRPYEEGEEVIIYIKGGPVRVKGDFRGAYTVVTSGWDASVDNNCLDEGCAGYDGYSTYRRHAWFNNVPTFGGIPIDTLPANIWIVGDLENIDTGIGDCGGESFCPPQPCPFDPFTGDPDCDFLQPGDCGGSENIMGLVSAANVVIANSPENRTGGIDIHASIAALNESFVMHYWQHSGESCPGAPPFRLNIVNQYCNQNPPQADNRGAQIYGVDQFSDVRGDIRLCGGVIQSYRGYMKRGEGGQSQYDPSIDIGMDKEYNFDNNLYFPPPGAITINECESSTVRMSMIDYGRPK